MDLFPDSISDKDLDSFQYVMFPPMGGASFVLEGEGVYVHTPFITSSWVGPQSGNSCERTFLNCT